MPFISANPPAGPVTFCYTIATPTCNNSKSIDPSIPTVFLVVPYYTAQQVWHPQLCNPSFRRFNLVTFDPRGQGRTVGTIPKVWREEVAAEDVHHLMEVLNISECHIIDLISDNGLAATTARASTDPRGTSRGACILGGSSALMLTTNGDKSKLTMAMVDIVLPYELQRNGRVEALEEVSRMAIEFFANRDSYPRDGLRQVECPILLVHCSEDVAYPIELAKEVEERMEEAGLDVSFVSVDGAPHYGTFTHHEQITSLMHDFVLRHCKGNAPTIPGAIESPFEPDFIAVDCPDLGRELDDEVEFFS